MAGQQHRALGERLLFAPFTEGAGAGYVGAGDRHAWCECINRFAVGARLFLIALGDPGKFAEAVAAVRVRLVADLDSGKVRSERAVGGRHLACGGGRFVVGHADGEQHLPAAAPRKCPELVQLRRPDRAGCPGRPRRLRIGPGDILIGGDATEAQHPRPKRAQQLDEIAMVGVLGKLA